MKSCIVPIVNAVRYSELHPQSALTPSAQPLCMVTLCNPCTLQQLQTAMVRGSEQNLHMLEACTSDIATGAYQGYLCSLQTLEACNIVHNF